MELAKSVFGVGTPDGYSSKRVHAETLSEDEDDAPPTGSTGDGVSVSATTKHTSSSGGSDFNPTPGGPFSALTPSMWPQDILHKLSNPPEDATGQLDYRYDEFGFKVEEEDGPEENSSKLLSTPFIENAQHRLKWTAYLEFTHNQEVGDLTWDKVESRLPHSEKLKGMIKHGIPHSMRPQIWLRISGALETRHRSDTSYKDIVKASSNDNLMTSKQIEKDLLRTLPSNACFCNIGSTGIPRLRRVLRGVAWLYPDIGYCQGTGMIAASLLLFMEEEETFWMMCCIFEDLLPVSYYSSTLIGAQADQRVLRQLIVTHLPDTDNVLKEHDIEQSLISLHWFLPAFVTELSLISLHWFLKAFVTELSLISLHWFLTSFVTELSLISLHWFLTVFVTELLLIKLSLISLHWFLTVFVTELSLISLHWFLTSFVTELSLISLHWFLTVFVTGLSLISLHWFLTVFVTELSLISLHWFLTVFVTELSLISLHWFLTSFVTELSLISLHWFLTVFVTELSLISLHWFLTVFVTELSLISLHWILTVFVTELSLISLHWILTVFVTERSLISLHWFLTVFVTELSLISLHWFLIVFVTELSLISLHWFLTVFVTELSLISLHWILTVFVTELSLISLHWFLTVFVTELSLISLHWFLTVFFTELSLISLHWFLTVFVTELSLISLHWILTVFVTELSLISLHWFLTVFVTELSLISLHWFLTVFFTELSLISLHWFLTAFASVVHMKVLLRMWDLFFYEGSVVFFQLTLGMLKMKERELVTSDNSAQIFNGLSDVPGDVQDVDELVEIAYRVAGSLTDVAVDTCRRKHLAYLMADQGTLINPEVSHNLPKQTVNKRHMRRSRSLVSMLLWGDQDGDDDPNKAKNIRQTEILVDLRESILQVARHFQSVDPKNHKLNVQADYSMESHACDLENYVNVARNRRRRAKALLDFERHDDDELGFRRNDIITIISQKDEHCWIGELNGLRGWFPAKFVELLDERSKNYSCAGDDSVTETVTDLVRGVMCPSMKAVFEHGLKRSSLLAGPGHPWLFIEEAATREVEKDFNSVYSRLVLCKTYRLDEDGKVLTPEEILYRAVQAVNLSHDAAHAQMDVKFRSLICCGLNEQVLHLWLETLCSCTEVVEKWYHPWSFMRSPGWVQVKCELRVLSRLAFKLSPDWELPDRGNTDKIRESVRDMVLAQFAFRLCEDWELPRRTRNRQLRHRMQDLLVSHHLFSWQL
ncbi:RUN and TBC1 domain-containing protein 3 [Lamellibrachia satsuma]|nr:RUN and TBC1 domain-containing protein 3 [Lamellibrachia satsuma]